MSVTLKCAACGAAVEFEELSPTVEANCPGCEVRVRYREGDQQMAIPVSMSLPESFRHVDLDSVAVKSSLLVGRYRKPASGEEKLNPEVVLAKALESLAHSISQLEHRLDRQEQGERAGAGAEDEGKTGANGVQRLSEWNGNGHQPGNGNVPEEETDGSGDQGVVQLKARGLKGASRKGKATPVAAQVLVRREAAREAHEFRRERHSQSDWDDAAEPSKGPVGFAWLMDRAPKTTIVVTMLCAVGLITWTIIAMDEMFTTKSEQAESAVKTRTTTLSMEYDADPESAMAEIMARGFLNAASLEAAEPFVYESETIREQMERYYRPLPDPGEYALTLKSRARTPDGKSIFAYNVLVPGEPTRRMVVLPEGNLPKVFWQFYAEIGDLSWDEFLAREPKEPVEMRVWIHPGTEYFDPYSQDLWRSYILHDWGETRQIFAYANRGASEDWRISDAISREPVKFNRHTAVMALVKVSHMATLPTPNEPDKVVVELKEVIATSWLPEHFRPLRDTD